MLKNAPTLAIVAAHIEENEPPKVWKQKFHYFTRVLSQNPGDAQSFCVHERAAARRPQLAIEFDRVLTKDPNEINEIFGFKTLGGSFSSVWTATIARVGAFFSIFRDLQDLHSFVPLQTQKFSKILASFC